MIRPLVASVVTCLALALPSAPAFAGFVVYDSSVTTASPTFNRPLAGTPPTGLSGVGTSVYYSLQGFSVSSTGSYTMTTASLFDTFLVLYQGSFDRSSPLTNALSADDDSGGNSQAQIIYTLSAGTQYFLVTTTFSNGATGAITTRIDGPGTPVLSSSAVPEPSSVALSGLGLAFVGGAIRRRRRAA